MILGIVASSLAVISDAGLGSELITDGVFANDWLEASTGTSPQGWRHYGNGNIDNGIYTSTMTASGQSYDLMLTQDVGATASTTYRVTFDVTSWNANFRVSFDQSATGYETITSNGAKTIDITVDSGGSGVLTFSAVNNIPTNTLDNISCKEILSTEIYADNNAAGPSDTNATTGWAGFDGTIVSTDAITAHDGTYSLQVSSTESTYGGKVYDFAATSGKTYTITVWAKKTADGSQQSIQMFNGGPSSESQSVSSETWTKFTFVRTCTVTEDMRLKAECYGSTQTLTAYIYLDKISILESRTVGNTDITAMATPSERFGLFAAQFTMPENGTIQSISVWHDTALNLSNSFQLGVYAESSSTPGDLLAETLEETTLVEGWNTLDLVTPLYVANATVIWLGCNNQRITVKYNNGTGLRSSSTVYSSFQDPMPDPFGAGSTGAYDYSIYATYTT